MLYCCLHLSHSQYSGKTHPTTPSHTMTMSDTEVHGGNAGASETYPIAAGALKKGSYCVINTRPCKIVAYSTSKPGKHGSAKAHIVGQDLFTSKKMEEICPTSHNMLAPNVSRLEYALVDIDGESLALLDDHNEMKYDLNLPHDFALSKRIRNDFTCGKDLALTVIAAMGQEAVLSVKEVK